MAIQQNNSTNVESSGVLLQESFSIGDTAFILNILRSKLYSNIIKVVTQEYSANAKDANVESGNSNTPITITLPNYLEPTWKCRDNGIGITPDRMSKVFLRYGVSTKRESNDQIGGFGIGAKSALGYADQFIVNTYIDGMKRSYSMFIDETKCGKMALLNESKTTEPNGTEIVVPIKQGDIDSFIQETYNATKHWTIKPIIKGGKLHRNYDEFTKDKHLITGENWFILRNSDNYYNGANTLYLVIGELEYPFPIAHLKKDASSRIFHDYYFPKMYFKFPVGAIEIAANREAVEINERTKKIVQDAFNQLKDDLIKSIEDRIKNTPTYFEANKAILEIGKELRFVEGFMNSIK